MEKRGKPIIAIFIAVTLLLSTAVISFAAEVSDPIGFCKPKQDIAR